MTWLGKFNLLRIVFFRRGQETFYGMCFSVEYFSFSTMNESQTFNAICQACQGQILQHETLTSIRRMWLQRGAAPPFGSRWNGEVFLSQPSCNKTISRKSGLSQAHGNRNMWTMHVSIFIYFFSVFPFSIQRGVSPIIMEKQSWDDMWTMHVCIFIYLSLLLFIYLGRREPHDHGKNIMKVFSDT